MAINTQLIDGIRARRELWISCSLLFITLAAFWPVKDYEFVNYDDPVYVAQNSQVLAGLTAAGIRWAFATGETGNWHPLTWISHMLDCQWYGPNPRGPHLTNLAFHIANTLLLFWLLREITSAVWPSALVAGLFAWHPMHVESVAWVAERKDVLSTFLGLLAIWAYARYAQGIPRRLPGSEIRHANPKVKGAGLAPSNPEDQNQKLEARNQTSTVFYILSLSLFALSLMAKPMLVTLPFLLLLLDWWPLGRFTTPTVRNWLRLVPEKIPFLGLAFASSVITYVVQQRGGNVASLALVPWNARLGNVPVAYVRYAAKLFWPKDLCVLYPLFHPWSLELVVGASAFLLVCALTVYWNRARAYLVVGTLWFAGMLVPVIGLVHIGSQAMADRYTYLSSVGLFIATTWGLVELISKVPASKFIAVPAAVAGLAGCLWGTHRLLPVWNNSVALFQRAVAINPDNSVALYNLAAGLMEKGKLDEGAAKLEEALRIEPGLASSEASLAWALSKQGRIAEAISRYQAVLRAEPYSIQALNNLAWILATEPNAQFRDGIEAVRLAERATELSGGTNALVIGTLAAAHAEAGQFDAAVACARMAAQVAESRGEQTVAATNRRLLELYQARRPYHEP
ncbi:MAG TPA: hypothetical protein VN281_10250 [Verrucomicrobiae bacterium]|jgi:tetratricopeptide (TPR) repeat protein|nr:hypothetical protein [Verrucomicrobiae bacterium]